MNKDLSRHLRCEVVGWPRSCPQLQQSSGGPGKLGHLLPGEEAQAVRNKDPDISQPLKTHLADMKYCVSLFWVEPNSASMY